MLGACRLNNKSMRGIRREAAYQCMAIDLAMLGVISKEECEMLIGSGIPKNVLLPDGSAGKLISEENLPKNDIVQVEQTEETEQVETEGTTEGAEVTEQVEQTEEAEVTEGSDSDEGAEVQE